MKNPASTNPSPSEPSPLAAEPDASQRAATAPPEASKDEADKDSKSRYKRKKEPRAPMLYRGVLLMPGSAALRLHDKMAKDPEAGKSLDKHMKSLEKNAAALREGRLDDYEFIANPTKECEE